jgi:hypothetical protein
MYEARAYLQIDGAWYSASGILRRFPIATYCAACGARCPCDEEDESFADAPDEMTPESAASVARAFAISSDLERLGVPWRVEIVDSAGGVITSVDGGPKEERPDIIRALRAAQMRDPVRTPDGYNAEITGIRLRPDIDGHYHTIAYVDGGSLPVYPPKCYSYPLETLTY